MFCVLALQVALCAAALAQEQAAPQPAKPPEPASVDLTVDAVQARLKQAEDAKDIDEELKKKLVDSYKEALGELRAAEEWAAKAQAFEKLRQDAPALLEGLKAELAKPPVEAKPDVPQDASVAQLEQRVTQAEAELTAAQKEATELEAEPKRRADRRVEAPKLLATAKQRLEDVTRQIGAPPAAEPQQLALARRTLLLARKRAVEKQISAYEKEMLSYDARGDLLTARRDRATKRAAQAAKAVEFWRSTVNERRRAEARRAAQQARDAQSAAARAHPAVQKIADRNAHLAGLRSGDTGMAAKIERISGDIQEATRKLTSLRDARKSVDERVQAGGLTHAIALLLRKQRAQLPNLRALRRQARARRTEISDAQLQLLELGDQRSSMSDVDSEVADVLAGLGPSVSQAERDDIQAAAKELILRQRELLEALIGDYDSYFVKLVDLDTNQGQLIAEAQAYGAYIDRRIMWIRSAPMLGPGTLPKAWEALCWLGKPTGWHKGGIALWAEARSCPAQYALALLIVAALFLAKPMLRRRLQALAELLPPVGTDKFSHTVSAALLTVMIALPTPLCLWLIGWRLAASVEPSELVRALAAGLRLTALLYFTLAVLRAICLTEGLGEAHFRWHCQAMTRVRRHLTWLMLVTVPMALVFSTIEAQSDDARKDSLGRLAFIVGLVALAAFAQKVLHPSGEVMKGIIHRYKRGWVDRFRHLWHTLGVGAPLLLALIAAMGSTYAAVELESRLRTTLLLVLAAVLLHETMVRWLFVVRRRLAVQKADQRRAEQKARAEAKASGEATKTEDTPALDKPQLKLYDMGLQARRVFHGTLGVALVIATWLTWVDVLPALAVVNEVKLWPTTIQRTRTVPTADGQSRVERSEEAAYVTLADVLLAIGIVVVTVIASRNIPGLLEIVILQRLPMDPGTRFATTALAQYAITTVGVILAFGTVGIGWAKVQWLVAAMTVGLGFGLQEIFANFVSGLIILFERPIRVGDTVTVGDVTGTVTRIRIRATTITDWDRKELVVPNKSFITGQLVNWSLSDSILRMRFPVGIAYGSDTALAHKVLLEVAKNDPIVLAEPPPSVVFKGFGDSALDFELRAFIPGMDDYVKAWDQVNTAVDRAFRDAKIEIAFPQRDIHIRSIRADLPLVDRRGKPS